MMTLLTYILDSERILKYSRGTGDLGAVLPPSHGIDRVGGVFPYKVCGRHLHIAICWLLLVGTLPR